MFLLICIRTTTSNNQLHAYWNLYRLALKKIPPYSIKPWIPRFPGNTAPSLSHTRAWLLRSRYVAIENSITSIRVDADYAGLKHSTEEGW